MKKRKMLDCIEMKNRIQRRLMAEYQKRRHEFSTYMEFLNATADADPQVREFRARIAKSQPSVAR